jgi:hypothetical protein
VNEDYSKLIICYRAESIDQTISAEELTLIESVMPDLIIAMLHNQTHDND